MGDVLSQNEIDNLLAALSTGELDVDEIKDNNEKKVKEYDVIKQNIDSILRQPREPEQDKGKERE